MPVLAVKTDGTKLFLFWHLVALGIVVSAGRSFGQSTFYFANYLSGGLVDAPVFNSDGSRLSGTTYVAMLYGCPTADSLSPAVVGLTPQTMSPSPFADEEVSEWLLDFYNTSFLLPE